MTPENVSTYSYNNSFMKDVLTHYTSTNGNIDSDVLFDEVGNITYFNGQTYTWNANRQLETVLTADNDLIRYYYNENGFLSRLDMYDDNGTVCSGSLSYIWNGDVLVSRYVTDYESDEITYSNIIYDTEGDAVGTVISQTTDGVTNELFLLYRKNLQGDITGMVDSVTGQLVAAYTYDAYGNVSCQPVGDNSLSAIGSAIMLVFLPQAYRGYTFSFVGEELCYYLGSRFYSPRLGRFLNADKHFDTGTGVLGTNMYAYCNNNPVMYTDPTGEVLRILKVFTAIVTALNKVTRNIKANSISKKGLEMAPLSDHIKTMQNKYMTYSYTDKYELYQVTTSYYTKTFYYNEEFTIATVSTSVKNWYKIIDEVRAYTNLYGILSLLTSIVGDGIKIAEAVGLIETAGFTLPGFLSNLATIATAIGIPVALIIASIDSTVDGVEFRLREKQGHEIVTFNVEVTRTYWVIGMNEPSKEVLHTIVRVL